jgi:N-succinyldiaminopimelate aminotransferase
MNPLLSRLQPYPFERLRKLFAGVQPPADVRPISLGIGEPRHATPAFIEQALSADLGGLARYPATAGEPALREACARWARQRYGIALDAATQVLPVNGSREALFAFTQVVVDASQEGARVICPNPFYQIYEGATLLAGAQPYYAPSDAARNFAVDWDSVPADVWEKTQLIFVCSPGNPTGAVMPLAEWEKLFALSDRYGFVIASDECYSEIYFDGTPPLGGLEAAQRLGRTDYRNLLMFTSLSKRSNVPGLRSGFVAGDAALIKAFLLYRTYHGGAMSPVVQTASIAAWGDEAHVEENRRLYREKFNQVTPVLARDGCAPARCQLLPVGRHSRIAGPGRRRVCARAVCRHRRDRAAGQLPGPRGRWPQPWRRTRAHGPGGRDRRVPGSGPPHCTIHRIAPALRQPCAPPFLTNPLITEAI